MEHKAYLHRSGRTARAGAAGTVVTVTIPSQRRDVADLLRKAGITAPLEQVTSEAAPIAALVGEPADYVKPAPVQAVAPQRASKPRSASQGQGGRGNGRGAGGEGRGPAGGGRSSAAGAGRGAQGQGRGGRSGAGRADSAAGSSPSRPFYSTGTGQPSQASHAPRAERASGPRRASHNGQRSSAPRG